MEMMPLKPERKAQLDAYAKANGQSAAEALDDLLAAQLTSQASESEEAELSPEEWIRQFRAWSQSHAGADLPILSDEAISRESIYRDRGL